MKEARRKRERIQTMMASVSGTEKKEKIHFRDLQMRKKGERNREEKRKEKEERGTKKAGKRPSYSPQRPAILGGAEGRFWLGQAHSVSE